MSFLFGLLLFFVNVYLAIYFFTRAVVLPSVLLVVSPTALARRFIQRSKDGKSNFDINVDVRNLSDRLATPSVLSLTAAVAVLGYALGQNMAYLWIAGAMLVTLFAEQDKMDERIFEIWTRALAAVSDAVIVGVLFFVTIFRLQVDAFALLTFMFFLRELLLFFARRWLESEPEFENYDQDKKMRVALVVENDDSESGRTEKSMVGFMFGGTQEKFSRKSDNQDVVAPEDAAQTKVEEETQTTPEISSAENSETKSKDS
jgi:hypothetical protein